MNRLNATIRSIESDNIVSIVDLMVNGHKFSAQVLDSSSYKVGLNVEIIFKESEIVIAKDLMGNISSINRFKATIKNIIKDKIMSEITLDFDGADVVAIITTRSTNRLDLMVGDEVEFLIKANEISIGVNIE